MLGRIELASYRHASLAFALIAVATLGGCLSTRNERIRVRRDPPGPSFEERRKLTDEQYETRVQLPAEVREREGFLKRSGEEIDRARRTPRDPWASFEADRRRVLLQPWADTGKPPAPMEAETLAPQVEEAPTTPAKKGATAKGGSATDDDMAADKKPDDKPAGGEGAKKPDAKGDGDGEKKTDDGKPAPKEGGE